MLTRLAPQIDHHCRLQFEGNMQVGSCAWWWLSSINRFRSFLDSTVSIAGFVRATNGTFSVSNVTEAGEVFLRSAKGCRFHRSESPNITVSMGAEVTNVTLDTSDFASYLNRTCIPPVPPEGGDRTHFSFQFLHVGRYTCRGKVSNGIHQRQSERPCLLRDLAEAVQVYSIHPRARWTPCISCVFLQGRTKQAPRPLPW